jgi:hypothetical protein
MALVPATARIANYGQGRRIVLLLGDVQLAPVDPLALHGEAQQMVQVGARGFRLLLPFLTGLLRKRKNKAISFSHSVMNLE